MVEQSGSVVFYQPYKYSSMNGLQGIGKMHGARRVIAFCCMTAVLPTILLIIPLYLRHSKYANVVYDVAESDVVEMGIGISTVFCEELSLRMNSTFSAFQLSGEPKMSKTNRKHIQLKKSMTLPDDTQEYWGFYLPKGSTVNVTVCARYEGGNILVVGGERVLPSCKTPNGESIHHHMAQGRGQVKVTHEGAAEEILHSDSTAYRKERGFMTRNEEMMVDENHGGEVEDNAAEPNTENDHRQKRHHKTRMRHLQDAGLYTEQAHGDLKIRRQSLENELYDQDNVRHRRNAGNLQTLDHGAITHGGDAINHQENGNDSSVSSFEQSLLNCHDEKIIKKVPLPLRHQCVNFDYILNNGTNNVHTTHDIVKDGYYYYIFYSDNDFKDNNIFVIFDIYKPTYEYGNYTLGCKNTTECRFPIKMFSDEMVVVEVPTRDGIEHESDDITHLISTCHPRTAVYAVFPVTVLFLILGCAFL